MIFGVYLWKGSYGINRNKEDTDLSMLSLNLEFSLSSFILTNI